MSQIMNFDIVEPGRLADRAPRPFDIGHCSVGRLAWKDIEPRRRGAKLLKQSDCRLRQRHPMLAALFGVRGRLDPDARAEVELVPCRIQRLAQPGAGQDQELQRGGGTPLAVPVQRSAEALQLLGREVSLPLLLRIPVNAGCRIIGAPLPSDRPIQCLA